MFVCLSKALTGSEVEYTVVSTVFPNKDFVLSKYKMFCLIALIFLKKVIPSISR